MSGGRVSASPTAPVRRASATSNTATRSNSPSGLVVISSTAGRYRNISGTTSAQAMTTSLPRARTASPKPSSEPSASPSGLTWVITSTRCARAIMPRAISSSVVVIVGGTGLRAGGCCSGVVGRRRLALNLVKQGGDVLGLFGGRVPVEDDLRRPPELHPAGHLAADKTFGPVEYLHHFTLAFIVTDRRDKDIGVF